MESTDFLFTDEYTSADSYASLTRDERSDALSHVIQAIERVFPDAQITSVYDDDGYGAEMVGLRVHVSDGQGEELDAWKQAHWLDLLVEAVAI